MTSDTGRVKVAILDDYQNVALEMADWSAVSGRADVTVFNDHVSDPDELVDRLAPFDVVFVMRERTPPLPRSIIERLPKLKMIASTGPFNASIDMAAAEDHGIHVGDHWGNRGVDGRTDVGPDPRRARNLVAEARSVRDGGWQTSVGRELSGRVLGVLGLGRIGARVARIGEAFGMEVIAWSQNLTPEAAAEAGASYVGKDELFSRSDVLTIHMKLSERSTGLVGAAELALMKPTALLVNTSRGPIVDEAALVQALKSTTLQAALDVFDTEPLPPEHPLRNLDTVIATPPHIGYVADRPYRIFFRDAVAAIAEWLDRR